MAKIDHRGIFDDGSRDLTVAGGVTTGGVMTSSVGNFGSLSTFSNNLIGQVLGTPNTFVQIQQWLTTSLSSPSITPVSSSGSMTVATAGAYVTLISLSFSGSAGTYTFNVFRNGVLDTDAQIQATIAAAQSFPVAVSITDLDFLNAGDVLDVRVKTNNAGANFQLGNGNFSIFRFIG